MSYLCFKFLIEINRLILPAKQFRIRRTHHFRKQIIFFQIMMLYSNNSLPYSVVQNSFKSFYFSKWGFPFIVHRILLILIYSVQCWIMTCTNLSLNTDFNFNNTFCLCLSHVRSLLPTVCWLFVYIIYVFRSLFCT